MKQVEEERESISRDIKEELRAIQCFGPEDFKLLIEAADRIEELEISTRSAIVEAHIAGQADAGVGPEYSNAQAYCRKVFTEVTK